MEGLFFDEVTRVLPVIPRLIPSSSSVLASSCPRPCARPSVPSLPLQPRSPILKMTQFSLTTTTTKTRKVRKASTIYLCNLEYPPALDGKLPLSQQCQLDSSVVKAFYDVPVAGDIIEAFGGEWQVTSRRHYPYTPYSRGEKRVSELNLKLLFLFPYEPDNSDNGAGDQDGAQDSRYDQQELI